METGSRRHLGFVAALLYAAGSTPGPARMAFGHALPALRGDHLSAQVVEVRYGPGGYSLPHAHPCPVIGYVVDGALLMQVKGEPEAVYRAGEGFYEPPNVTHLVSHNASETTGARFIAVLVCDQDAVPSGGR